MQGNCTIWQENFQPDYAALWAGAMVDMDDIGRTILENYGCLVTEDEVIDHKLIDALKMLYRAGFRPIFKKADVHGIFVFDSFVEGQRSNLTDCLGIYIPRVIGFPPQARVSIIGIAADVFDYPQERIIYLILHEVVHGLTRDHHGARYHNKLDRLIDHYNQVTGGQIYNLYCGLPDEERDLVAKLKNGA